VFVLCLFVLFLGTNLTYLLTIPNYRVAGADLAGYLMLAGIYALSRTRYCRIATVLLLGMFPLNVFANVIQGTTQNPTATLSYLGPGYILASIFVSEAGVALLGGLVTTGILLLPLVAPDAFPGYTTIVGLASLSVIVVVLLVIAMRFRNQIERDHQAELRGAYHHTLESWARALEIRDKETEGHSRRVTELALQLARACGIHGQELEHIERGALLHDIGKMGIPDAILHKRAPLSEDEWAVMRTHPRLAYELLAGIPFLDAALKIAAYHHERWDGKGYPFALRGEEIPLAARIFAVVDVWDALLSDRPYRRALPREQVVSYLREQRGTLFDPAIVDRFLSLQAAR
jgi:putative nucleotidyltransferase with HDIG domain